MTFGRKISPIQNIIHPAWKARQECKRQTESLKVLPEYRDRNNIERLSRDIDQLNFHASKVKTVMTIASSK